MTYQKLLVHPKWNNDIYEKKELLKEVDVII